jgi:hypothetical protein
MRIHRAITLVLMMALAVLLVVAMTVDGIGTLGAGGLVALAVVIVAAAVAGIAFSYRRYFARRR